MENEKNTNNIAPEQPEEQKGMNRKPLVLVVVIMLLLTNAFLLWQFFTTRTENATLTAQKQELKTSLDSVSAEYNQVKTELARIQQENSGLQSKLADADAQLQTQSAKIELLIREKASVDAIRAEVGRLRNMKNEYESRISELEAANVALTSKNKQLDSTLVEASVKNKNLQTENSALANKVAIGSVMKAKDVSAAAVKFKSSGKEVDVKKAKDVQKLRVCMTILENKVVNRGAMDIYLRILGPDNSVLSTSTPTFMFNGQYMPYTTKQEIEYENQDKDICVYWGDKQTPYAKGKYTVEVYAGGNLIGKGDLDLK